MELNWCDTKTSAWTISLQHSIYV